MTGRAANRPLGIGSTGHAMPDVSRVVYARGLAGGTSNLGGEPGDRFCIAGLLVSRRTQTGCH